MKACVLVEAPVQNPPPQDLETENFQKSLTRLQELLRAIDEEKNAKKAATQLLKKLKKSHSKQLSQSRQALETERRSMQREESAQLKSMARLTALSKDILPSLQRQVDQLERQEVMQSELLDAAKMRLNELSEEHEVETERLASVLDKVRAHSREHSQELQGLSRKRDGLQSVLDSKLDALERLDHDLREKSKILATLDDGIRMERKRKFLVDRMERDTNSLCMQSVTIEKKILNLKTEMSKLHGAEREILSRLNVLQVQIASLQQSNGMEYNTASTIE
jgi:chromosome segregation ATPase